MDTFVDFCWQDMLSLAYAAVTLLVIEVVVVHATCIVYELWLAQRCNMAHAKIFSTFLALPTATVRQMTQRPLQVGDDTAEDADDDDEADLLDPAPTAAGEATASAKPAGKSVRMEVAGGQAVDCRCQLVSVYFCLAVVGMKVEMALGTAVASTALEQGL
eukprot:GHUV01034161.1.p1 GENE.GHUV01034161.1~~GHUV01034161.1.p1  ORF type:complete len:160 (+),score=58.26 GHUV01034161.1:592-1071(+)